MIIIDPYMLAIPDEDELDKEVILDYAYRLVQWESVFSRKREYSVSDWASDAIAELGLWPTRSNLRALFTAHNVSEQSARDVSLIASLAMTYGHSIEKWAGLYDSDILKEVECIKGTEIVIPEEIRARLPPTVAEQFFNALGCVAYACQARQDPTVCSIATAPLEKEAQSGAEMLLECDIVLLTDDANIEQIRLFQAWPLLFDPEHLYVTYDILDFYQSDPYIAVQIAWCKMKAKGEGKGFKGVDSTQFTFGLKFLESLDQRRIQRRPHLRKDLERVFEAVVYVLENVWSYNSDKYHALRKDINNRDSPQKTRKRTDTFGNLCRDKAARVEVTAGDNGLHLHYWQCFDGSYEFANVTDEHNDTTIYDAPPKPERGRS